MMHERHNWGKVWQEGLALKNDVRRTERKKGNKNVRMVGRTVWGV